MPKLAVLGQPVAHSRSPAMHSAALEEMGLASAWSYEAIEVAPNAFADRVRALRGEGFVGLNVTVPHKLAALAVADEASDAAAAIGAANTLSLAEGRIAAENTDAAGIVDALGRPLPGVRALVLGAGGSARAAIWGLREEGARVAIWNRTAPKAAALAAEMGVETLSAGDGEELPLADYDVLVNATIVGMKEASSAPGRPMGADPDRGPSPLKRLHVDADALSARHAVVDLVYGAREAPLAAAAKSRGAEVVDGLEVLVHQGAASLRLWTGMEPPIDIMRQAARAR